MAPPGKSSYTAAHSVLVGVYVSVYVYMFVC